MNAADLTEVGISTRKRMAAIAIALAFLGCVWASSGMVERAAANNQAFCTNVWLAPKGQPSSECGGPSLGNLYAASVQAFEHSSCVAAIDYAYHYWGSGWYCTAGPNETRIIYPGAPEGGPLRRGNIRNNSTGAFTHASGVQTIL